MLQKLNLPLCILLVSLSAAIASAVELDTRDIDRVRAKAVLDSSDLQVIDSFLAHAVEELVSATEEDLVAIGEIRSAVLQRTNPETESAREQYAEQFYKSAAAYLDRALDRLPAAGDPHSDKIMLNLLVLADSLRNIRVAEVALKKLDVSYTPARYWATHAVTNPALAARLNSDSANRRFAERIITALDNRIGSESSGPILAVLPRFCLALDTPEARNLLLDLADSRIRKYFESGDDCYMADLEILKALTEMIDRAADSSPELARRFATLYSCAIQKYHAAMTNENLLPPDTKQDLVSLIVEVEQSCIPTLTGTRQSYIQTAIERNRPANLLDEHNELLGAPDTQGRLPRALNFEYRAADGSTQPYPPQLPQPPQSPPEQPE